MAEPQAAADTAAPTGNFDVAGARAAGYTDADIAGYLADKTGFDVQGARKAGYNDGDIIDHLSPPPPEPAAPPPEEKTGILGGIAKGFENLPADFAKAGGAVLRAMGSEAPDVPNAAIGPNDVQAPDKSELAGAYSEKTPSSAANVGKHLYDAATADIQANAPHAAPGSGADYAYQITQGVGEFLPILLAGVATKNPIVPAAMMGGEAYAEKYSESLDKGRTPEQAKMDADFTGSVNGALGLLPLHVLMKPGGTFLAKTLSSAGAMAFMNAATEAVQTGYDKNIIDPSMTWAEAVPRLEQAGIVGAVTGALIGGVGHGIDRVTTPKPEPQAQPAPNPTPEADAAKVMGAGSVDDAINAANAVVQSSNVDVNAMAETAKAQGEQNAAIADAQEAAAAPVDQQPLEDVSAMPTTGAAVGTTKADEPTAEYDTDAAARQIAPAAFQQLDALTTRQDSYREWLADLGAQRGKQPAALDAQANIDAILDKVGSVEARLTNAQSERLASARADLTAALHSDTPDMTVVRQKLLDVQHKLWDVSPAIQEAYRAAQERTPARPKTTEDGTEPFQEPQAPHTANDIGDVKAQAAAVGEPLSEPESKQIAAQMDGHGLDAKAALNDHIERKAIREVYFDHDKTGDPAYAPGVTLDRRAGTGDQGSREGVEGFPPAAVGAEGTVAPREAVAPDTGRETSSAEKPLATFTTAKGSTYEVHADGTTTRNKAARADLGHEGQQGPQSRSERTVYVTKGQADELGLFQTQGGPRMAIAERPDGAVGVKYLDGPNAGKFERRTVVKPSDKPAVGLTPVETWKGGTRVHFGNEITEVRDETAPPPAANDTGIKPRAKALKAIEGEGDERERAISGETYKTGTEAPQIEAMQKLGETDRPSLIAMALRQKDPPPGVHPEFAFMEAERIATREGDASLIARLNKSKIAEEATTMGQRNAAWRNRDPYSAVAQIQSVEAARSTVVEKRSGDVEKAQAKEEAAVNQGVATARKQARALTPRETWAKYIASITCRV